MTSVKALAALLCLLQLAAAAAAPPYGNEVARIKCEYNQNVDGDSLVLNCSLLTGSASLAAAGPNQSGDLSGLSFITNGVVGSAGPSPNADANTATARDG